MREEGARYGESTHRFTCPKWGEQQLLNDHTIRIRFISMGFEIFMERSVERIRMRGQTQQQPRRGLRGGKKRRHGQHRSRDHEPSLRMVIYLYNVPTVPTSLSHRIVRRFGLTFDATPDSLGSLMRFGPCVSTVIPGTHFQPAPFRWDLRPAVIARAGPTVAIGSRLWKLCRRPFNDEPEGLRIVRSLTCCKGRQERVNGQTF
jgi:hypothetical protein